MHAVNISWGGNIANVFISVFVEPDSRIRLNEIEVDFVAQEFADVAYTIPITPVSKWTSTDHEGHLNLLDHSWAFKTQSPAIDPQICW